MGSLSAALSGAASALDALQYALNVSQNNIANASTPGYARQTASLQADPFDPVVGLFGGVAQGPIADSRDLLAERAVWQQAGAQGAATAQNEALTDIQNSLPVSAGGIPAALNNFFSAVSAWSASPTDGSTKQAVITAAASLTQSFNTTAAGVANVSQNITQSISDTVSQINDLTSQLASLNEAVQGGAQHDAGVSAQMYNTLETLSGLVNIEVLPQQDGTVQVTLAGGQPLVVGTEPYQLRAGSAAPPANPIDPQAPPDAAIFGPDGNDVTNQINSGTLHGQLQVRNSVIPALTGDQTQAGALNQLATSLATTVNSTVGQGFVSNGVPAATGLFVAPDPAHPDTAALNLAVDSNMSAAGLPPILNSGGATIPNGVPLALNALASTPQIDNVTYTAFYGNAAASVGRQLNQAQSNQTLATQSLAQAQSMRQTAEGVDLNAEAVKVIQFQQGYQAAAKLVSTLNSLNQALLDMLP
jgi:flagellar hook-associated protein 1 FlgK